MFYIIGDIHGYLDKLLNLFSILKNHVNKDDTFIFLGDYIDRGPDSYEVIEFLIDLSQKMNVVFLAGNHEDMLKSYLESGELSGIFMYNGGRATMKSYKKNRGSFELPYKHRVFFDKLEYYYEGDDFIAVHAGLNPGVKSIEGQSRRDMIWIREEFFNNKRRWGKTIIFGHTPTTSFGGAGLIYFDDDKNIIGIDSGVIYGRELSCLRWPDRKIFHSDY